MITSDGRCALSNLARWAVVAGACAALPAWLPQQLPTERMVDSLASGWRLQEPPVSEDVDACRSLRARRTIHPRSTTRPRGSTTSSSLLGDAQHSAAAARELVAAGPAVVPFLTGQLSAPVAPGEPVRTDRDLLLLWVLASIGGDHRGGGAAPSAGAIVDILGEREPQLHWQAAWALGELGPAALVEHPDLLDRLRAVEPDGAARVPWRFAVARLELGSDPADRCASSRRWQTTISRGRPAAARALTRHAVLPRAVLHVRLRAAFRDVGFCWLKFGVDYEWAAVELASAVVRLPHTDGDTVRAWTALLRHHDPVRRRAAAEALGGVKVRRAEAARALAVALGDSSLEVVTQAYDSLAALREHALYAIDTVDDWRRAADVERATLARVGYRGIRGAVSPAARAALEVAESIPEDRAAAIDRAAVHGPSLVVPLAFLVADRAKQPERNGFVPDAVDLLGVQGRQARAARPLLERLAALALDDDLHDRLERALSQIAH